jgi:hypothetical protein
MEPDNNNDENENVRQPDQVIVETLIDNDSDFYDYDNEAYLFNEEINRTINVSMLELKRKEELEELELLRLITEERDTVLQKFSTIKDKINKIYHIDKLNSQIYESVLSYIELYEITYILYNEIDKETYDKIFNCINRIRFTNEEKQSLFDLFIVIVI